MHADESGRNYISQRVVGCAFTVFSALGRDFLNSSVKIASAHERRKAGLTVGQQHGLTITCDGIVIGEYVADPVSSRRCWLN
ncbi:MAG TPA: hypothetical protein DDZ81_09735 [Acetobacteraceae bacterium]|nr:hypothetical protein [Acetobacteraceae bacterium]